MCVIILDANIDKEIDNRLTMARHAFDIPCNRAWYNYGFRTDVDVTVYRDDVLTTVLYGAESLMTYSGASLNSSIKYFPPYPLIVSTAE